ncbi:MAG: aminotransferase class III-fold pyridoxal phosphate-dependent enzyme [Planctomycetota bacterium]
MPTQVWLYVIGVPVALCLGYRLYHRLRLSKAKHRSLTGHSKMAKRVAKLLPFYEYGEERFFACDGAPEPVARARREALERLCATFRERAPKTIAQSQALEAHISDVEFTNAYRVPFQFRNYLHTRLQLGCLLEASAGRKVRDLDGNWSYDLSGSYGTNVFGYDFYKECVDAGIERSRELGPVLGPYHPVIADNVRRLKAISGMDEVSFHMSGTEAVMQAVGLARYHTGRNRAVRFCGAYHGWWDGVQPGIGNPRKVGDVFTLKEMDADALYVLRTRKDIACVLVNPLQALHPNAGAPGDATLVSSKRRAGYDREAYRQWLMQLREVCTARSIVLIIDDVFLGFRLAYGGTQEYFGVCADMVTYGKTVGGGLPIGVVCGRADLMKRYRPGYPSDICFARGTFNSHPYVMASMNEFLRRTDAPEMRASYARIDELWDGRAAALNARLEAAGTPVRVANMVSVWTTLYRAPSRYNWMLQFYLRAQGLSLSWVGSGRYIFSHDFTDEEFAEVSDRFVAAAEAMKADGWWWEDASLTSASISRTLLGEILRTKLGRSSVGQRA